MDRIGGDFPVLTARFPLRDLLKGTDADAGDIGTEILRNGGGNGSDQLLTIGVGGNSGCCTAYVLEGTDADGGDIGPQILRNGGGNRCDHRLTVLDRCVLNDRSCNGLSRSGSCVGGFSAKTLADRAHDHAEEDDADQAEENSTHTHKNDEHVAYAVRH